MRISDWSSYVCSSDLNLGFARSTKKAETAALSLQVSPTPHQPTCLIVEIRQFNLQPAFSGRGALTENFQDQASAVDYLRLGCLFQITFLNRLQAVVDDDQFGFVRIHQISDHLILSATDQRSRHLAKTLCVYQVY